MARLHVSALVALAAASFGCNLFLAPSEVATGEGSDGGSDDGESQSSGGTSKGQLTSTSGTTATSSSGSGGASSSSTGASSSTSSSGTSSTGAATTGTSSTSTTGSGSTGMDSAGVTTDVGQPCSPKECGPAPGQPSQLCPDGVNMAGPGPCERQSDGTCAWSFLECPPCCDPAASPKCFEGADCCGDGTWACREGNGSTTCPTGALALACQTSDGGSCLDNGDCKPDTFCARSFGACADKGKCEVRPQACPRIYDPVCGCDGKTYSNACGAASAGVAVAEKGACTCMPEGGSCSAGETCCGGLECCVGVPVPQGKEYCGNGCPRSDRNLKDNVHPVDTRAVLEEVVHLPLHQWNYSFQDPSIRHLGPMAQDFHAAFGLGGSDVVIHNLDAQGVALASIQALHREVTSVQKDNERLRKTIEKLEARLSKLEK